MGLAGESMTESTWLGPFARSLLQVKSQQSTLIDLLDQLQAKIPQNLDPKLQALLTDARTTASQSRRAMSDCTTELDDFSRRSTQLADRLYQEVIHSQMRPFSDISSSFPRMVRDLARQVDKPIKLEVLGSNTPIDRDILERLESPLTHLLNNAVDHGIEPQDDRTRAGKPAHGTLSLYARHRAGTLIISLQDDGGGIDIPQLRQHILTRNLATPELIARLSEPELLEFLYLPGFSTNPTVTDLSGRGVGLDVVHNLVHSVGGSLKTTTQKGVGTTVSMHLPLTLSVLRTLVVDIAGHPYAFPMTRLDRVLTLSAGDIRFAESRPYFVLDDQAIGLVQAHHVLALPESHLADPLTVLVLGDRNAQYGLIVDRLLGEEKLVVKPIDPRLGKIPNLSATAVRSDGSIVFILDTEDLLQSMQKLHSPEHWQAALPEKPLTREQLRSIEGVCKKILAIDDSITVRATERKLLENQGYQVDTAVNGADGWNTLQLNAYDLVITDVDMPRMNGLELVSEMKRSQMLQAIPVIIISYKDREDRLQGLEVGANYYLTKSSFQDDTLVQAVLDLIGPATTHL
jgi:two-component system, chemotaxis family, sensor histidine kinase and response regulator WspE